MALPPGFVLENEPQPSAAPAQSAPAPQAAAPALPAGFTLEDGEDFELDAAGRAPNDPLYSVVGEDGKPLPPEGGYGMDTRTGEWGLYGGHVTDDSPLETQGPPEQPEIGRGRAAQIGLGRMSLAGFDDELAGISTAIGNAIGLNDYPGENFWDVYERRRAEADAEKDAAFEQHPGAYVIGGIPGLLATGGIGASRLAATKLPLWLQTAILGAGQGFVEGAGSATPEPGGNFLDRLPEATTGGLTGAVIGPLGERAFRAVASGGRRLGRFVLPGNENRGLAAFQDRVDVDPAAMRAEAARMTEAGVPPRLVDVTTDEGRQLIRDVAGRNTPARAEVATATSRAYADAPERIAAQANRIGRGQTLTSREIAQQADEGRDVAMAAGMDPIRGQRVDFPEGGEFWDIMATSEGRSAARYAAGLVKDQETKTALLELAKPQKLPDGYKEIKAMQDQVRAMGLAPAAEQAALAQLPPLPEIPERVVTLDMVDKIARGFQDAAEVARRKGNNGRASVLGDYAKQIRASADEVSPDYARLRQEYGAASRVLDAARGEGRFRESSFLRSDPEGFQSTVAGASPEPAAVPRGGGRDTTARLQRLDHSPEGVDDLVYTTAAGDSVPIQIYRYPDGTAEIDVSWSSLPNKVGPAEIRSVMADIQEMFPDITQFAGERISGARARALAEKGFGVGDDVPPEAVIQQVPALSPEQVARVTPQPTPTISEADALAARARDDVRDAALEGRGQGAIPTASQIAVGSNQHLRNEALLGPEGARQLESAMDAEVRRVANSRAIDPRVGDQPRTRTGDAINDGFERAITAVVGAGVGASRWPLIHEAGRWLRQAGIRNVDAERLARDAISEDPARLKAAIDYLEKRGMRRDRAERFIRTYGSALGGRITGATAATVADGGSDGGPPPPSTPPNSTRALLNDRRTIQ